MSRHETIALLKQTRDLLSFHCALGIDEYPRAPALEALLQNEQPERARGPVSAKAVNKSKPEPVANKKVAAPAARKPTISLAEVRQEIETCDRCSMAAEPQARISGEGTPESGLLIIADPIPPAQGETGKPFTGQASELLTKMLAAIGLQRESVYLTTLFKCLPSRAPEPEELRECAELLRREISAVAPKIICTMGPLTARILLTTGSPLFKLRGRFHPFLELPLMPTFHPAYLLRNPEMKKATWQDLQAIQKELASKS